MKRKHPKIVRAEKRRRLAEMANIEYFQVEMTTYLAEQIRDEIDNQIMSDLGIIGNDPKKKIS